MLSTPSHLPSPQPYYHHPQVTLLIGSLSGSGAGYQQSSLQTLLCSGRRKWNTFLLLSHKEGNISVAKYASPSSIGKITTQKSLPHSALSHLPFLAPLRKVHWALCSALWEPGHPHHFSSASMATLACWPLGHPGSASKENRWEKLMHPITAASIFIRTNLLRSAEAVPVGSFSTQAYCFHLVS